MVENNSNVAEEIQQEAVVQAPEDNHSPEVPQVSDKEKNFNRLRETKEQLERENRELKQSLNQHIQKATPQPVQQDEELKIGDDDLVEGKVVKQLFRELKNLKSSHEQERLSTIPERLKTKFSDFDRVVTQENIEKLKHSEPELYTSITSGSDLYAKGVSAYKTLKALGYVEEDPYKAQKEVVQTNHNRPVSAQAIRGQGALSEANMFAKGLTPELRVQLQKEMEEAIKAR
jgi:hypothetical protein